MLSTVMLAQCDRQAWKRGKGGGGREGETARGSDNSTTRPTAVYMGEVIWISSQLFRRDVNSGGVKASRNKKSGLVMANNVKNQLSSHIQWTGTVRVR